MNLHNANLPIEELVPLLKRKKRGAGLFEFLETGNIIAYYPSSDLTTLQQIISQQWS